MPLCDSPLSVTDKALAAEALALSFRHYTGNYKQISRDNTYWQYRPYEGGEPATAIDWRQSARSETLYVRERVKKEKQTAFLWADSPPTLTATPFEKNLSCCDEAQILLLALARLLVQEDRQIVWLSALRPTCSSEAQLNDFAAQVLTLPPSPDRTPKGISLPPNAIQIFASTFTSDLAAWKRLFLLSAERKSSSLLLALTPANAPAETLAELTLLASRFGWPTLRHTPQSLPQETLSKIMTILCESQQN